MDKPPETADLLSVAVRLTSRSILLVALAVAAVHAPVACKPAAAPSPATPSATAPLAGAFTVLVRPPDRTNEPVSVDTPGALPVQSGGAMCLDVNLKEPAFLYLVWITAGGQTLPLYPWNNETLEITDISQAPPQRRATKHIFSPMLGRTWTFGPNSGVETVIFLARRTALPEGFELSSLLPSPPTPQFDDANTPVKLRLPRAAKQADATKMDANESALATYLQRLAKHFDLIEAIQFPHAHKSSAENAENPR